MDEPTNNAQPDPAANPVPSAAPSRLLSITLPSGLKCTYHRAGLVALKQVLGTLPILTATQLTGDGEEGTISELRGDVVMREIDGMIQAIKVCSVSPKFTDLDPVPDGMLHIDVLDGADAMALGAAIMGSGNLAAAAKLARPTSGIPKPS